MTRAADTTASLVIAETIADDGTYCRTRLETVDDHIELRDAAGLCATVPVEVIVSVMRRYGRPLDEGIPVPPPALPLAPGLRLHRLPFRAAVDADTRDYAVLVTLDAPPIAALATVIARALRFLAAAQPTH